MTPGCSRSLAAASLLLLTACGTLTADDRLHLATFDSYWATLRDRYPYFGNKAIDWQAFGKQYRAAVPFARQPIDFYHQLAGMLAELHDNHVSLSLPDALFAAEAPRLTRLDALEFFRLVRIQGGLYVESWPIGEEPTPPAHLAADLQALPEIVAVEGAPATSSLLNVLFTGPAGSAAGLLLRWHDGTLTHHALHRPTEPAKRRLIVTAPAAPATRRGPVTFDVRDGVGVLRIASFAMSDADTWYAACDAAIDAAIAHGGGLVVDVRGNSGGDLSAAMRALSRFLTEPTAMVSDPEIRSWLFGLLRVENFHSFVTEPRAPRFPGQVVVLADGSSASATEHFARMMQLQGAAVVGETTRGIEAIVHEFAGPDGSTLRFGEQLLLDEHGRRLQGEGVHPDIALPLQWDAVRQLGYDGARAAWDDELFAAARRELTRREWAQQARASRR